MRKELSQKKATEQIQENRLNSNHAVLLYSLRVCFFFFENIWKTFFSPKV